jgi:hypothetical protein
MVATLIVAAAAAGLAATLLGLVDAGHALDDLLAQLDSEASAMHRAASATVVHGASPNPMTRPSNSLKRSLETMPATADRILNESAPAYARWAARPMGDLIGLVPQPNAMSVAVKEYLDQFEQAQAEKARTESAITLRGRLLDLNYDALVQRIDEARTRTRLGLSQALTGVYVITLLSIAIAAYAVGRSREPGGALAVPQRSHR